MKTNLEGKNALITGAAMGIGAAAALAFAAEGVNLALVDLDHEALSDTAGRARALGVKVTSVDADLSDGAALKRAVEAGIAGLDGGLDILVNNVGVAKARTFDDLSDEDWEHTFALNFMSYVRTTRIALPILRERRGVIVNNGSDLARQPEAVPVDYSASKSAVLSLTKALARAEGPRIRVNAVAPGPIMTPLWSRPGGFADMLAKIHNMPSKEALQHEMRLRQMPLDRLGEPEDVANVMVFLASDLAGFVTGSVWGVDGGSIRSLI